VIIVLGLDRFWGNGDRGQTKDEEEDDFVIGNRPIRPSAKISPASAPPES